MNDRYLYRAKRIDSGEWVRGFYAKAGIGNDTSTSDVIFVPWIENRNEEWGFIKVDPSTICRCTGFKDEDGKKIFEGDIVGYIDCTSTENGYSEHYCRGLVAWDEETASFQVTGILSAESYEVLDRGCNVLGNIFDNPELLEWEE